MFEPLTVGFDWEMWLTSRAGMPVGGEALDHVTDRLRRRAPHLPLGLDVGQLELRSGVCRDAEAVRARAREAFALLAADAARTRRRVFPFAGHPLVRNFAGGHVHIGSVFDYAAGERLKQALARWVPALIALAAASPVTQARRGGFKSYRTAYWAYGCMVPVAPQPVATAQIRWGEDVCLKLAIRPTVEVRCCDSPSDPDLLAELALLAAGLASALGERLARADGACAAFDAATLDPQAFAASLANRHNAARHGLQASFVWEGREVAAAEVCAEALALASKGLRRFGGGAGDLPMLRRMVELRATQADWALAAVGEGDDGDDDFVLAARLADATERVPFRTWLAGLCQPLCVRAHERLEDLVLANVRGYTPWQVLRLAVPMPPAHLFVVLRDLARQGQVRLVHDTGRGLICLPARPVLDGGMRTGGDDGDAASAASDAGREGRGVGSGGESERGHRPRKNDAQAGALGAGSGRGRGGDEPDGDEDEGVREARGGRKRRCSGTWRQCSDLPDSSWAA